MSNENTTTIEQPAPAAVRSSDGLCGSVSQARKILLDLMDNRRPWAHSKNVYDWMEEIVDMAEQAFTGRRRPTYEEWAAQEHTIMRLTAPLKEHPEWHKGPCDCEECRSA